MEFVAGKISVIVVTYNSMPALQSCLTHLIKATEKIANEIIIVDNNSTDHSASMARNICPQARMIVNRANIGFAAACNLGSRKAEGEYLLFLNPDVYLDRNAITELVNFFVSQTRIGVAAGRMRFHDGSFQATCRKLPTIKNVIFSRGAFLSRIVSRHGDYTLPDYDTPTEIPAAAGTFMMVSNDLFVKIGRFDERFFMFMEDTDLCKRLIMAGFSNYFIPAAGGVHEWGGGSSTGNIRRSFYQHISVYRYFVKHVQGWVAYLILPLLLSLNLLFVTFIKFVRMILRE